MTNSRGKRKTLGAKSAPVPLVHHEYHMMSPGIEPETPVESKVLPAISIVTVI
jgi:hypothetical protein